MPVTGTQYIPVDSGWQICKSSRVIGRRHWTGTELLLVRSQLSRWQLSKFAVPLKSGSEFIPSVAKPLRLSAQLVKRQQHQPFHPVRNQNKKTKKRYAHTHLVLLKRCTGAKKGGKLLTELPPFFYINCLERGQLPPPPSPPSQTSNNLAP